MQNKQVPESVGNGFGASRFGNFFFHFCDLITTVYFSTFDFDFEIHLLAYHTTNRRIICSDVYTVESAAALDAVKNDFKVFIC